MRTVIEHYGMGLVELLAVMLTFIIILGCCIEGGVLSNMVTEYFCMICG